MIERKEYLEQLIVSREKNIIKVVTGVRRCGKSTLLKLYCKRPCKCQRIRPRKCRDFGHKVRENGHGSKAFKTLYHMPFSNARWGQK